MDISDLYTADLHEGGAEMQIRDQNGKKREMYLTDAEHEALKLKLSELRKSA